VRVTAGPRAACGAPSVGTGSVTASTTRRWWRLVTRTTVVAAGTTSRIGERWRADATDEKGCDCHDSCDPALHGPPPPTKRTLGMTPIPTSEFTPHHTGQTVSRIQPFLLIDRADRLSAGDSGPHADYRPHANDELGGSASASARLTTKVRRGRGLRGRLMRVSRPSQVCPCAFWRAVGVS
jgi:hypothetical protein